MKQPPSKVKKLLKVSTLKKVLWFAVIEVVVEVIRANASKQIWNGLVTMSK